MSQPDNIVMSGPNKHALAMHEAARAVLNDTLNPQSKTIKVSIVPSAGALGFVQFDGAPDRNIKTVANMESRIVALVAGYAAQTVLDAGVAPGAPDSSYEYARHLAEEVADNTVPNWRQVDPQCAQNIVVRCFERAKAMVKDNEQQIRKVCDALMQKGELTKADLASI